MKLTYNNPERAKERAQNIPLTPEEMAEMLWMINKTFINYVTFPTEHLQNVLDRLENLEHFHSVANGWEGLNRMQVNYEIVKP
jgi:hypothetical protein